MKNNAIIGQDALMGDIEKILHIFSNSDAEIRPHFFLAGPSGTGKSSLIKFLCHRNRLPYIEINGAQLTKEGTSGNSLSKALSPLSNTGGKPTVVFVDEFDKLFISGNSNSELAHETTNGVQNEFLKVLESDETAVFGDYGKYVNVSSKNVLFVFAGAFNGEEGITLDRLRELGIKTEFLGRVGIVYSTSQLTLDNLYAILENSALLNSYLQLFEDADREAVIYTIKGHMQKNISCNTLGARMVNTLIHQYFIKGGNLEEEAKKSTFQSKLSLKPKE